jgi:glyoxylase I family protein
MANQISTGPVHHLTLTVTDVKRSQEFYTNMLGFQLAADLSPRVLLSNGSMLLGLTPPSDSQQAISSDSFNENRIGLDHLSFSIASLDDLKQAVRVFDEHGVAHSEIVDLADFKINVLMLRDPDNIQIELTAPYS